MDLDVAHHTLQTMVMFMAQIILKIMVLLPMKQ